MPEYISNRQRQLKIGISSYTENQLVLDVTGNTNITGIGTIGDVTIGVSGIITSSRPGIATVVYYGDGSNLFGVSAFNVITQDATTNPVYPTFASNVGVSSVGISSENFVFIPSTGSLGIGTTNPTSKLTVNGDGLFTGVITASNFVGNLSGNTTTATTAGYASTAGISTVSQGLTGTPNIVVGIVTASSFFGSGQNLTDVQIGIQSGGLPLGFANTINFTGVGATFVTVSSGIATVNIPGIVKTYTYYIATEGQTIFASFYNAENVEIYMNGSKLSHATYIANDGLNVILNEPASQNDEIEIIGYYSYNFFNSYANYAENLIGMPNINVGIISAISYYGDGSNLTGLTTSLLDLTDIDVASVGNNKYLRYNETSDKFDFKLLDLADFSIDLDGGVSSTIYEPLEFIIGDGGNASTIYTPTDLTFGGGGA